MKKRLKDHLDTRAREEPASIDFEVWRQAPVRSVSARLGVGISRVGSNASVVKVKEKITANENGRKSSVQVRCSPGSTYFGESLNIFEY